MIKQMSHLFKGTGEDITILSPDWGVDYKKAKQLDLTINHEDLVRFAKKQLNTSQWLVLYIPVNYNLPKLFRSIRDVVQYRIYHQGTLLMVFLQSNKYLQDRLPSFELEDVQGNMIQNKDYELTEQELLYKYVDENDSVLQLGGNIGTSCILVDKLRPAGTNVCVEPNQSLISLLERNKKNTNSRFVIVDGILSNESGKVLIESDDMNKYGSFISDEQIIDENVPGKIVKNYDFNALNDKYQFTALLVDCEGCFESFLDEYPDALATINTIIIEMDNADRCDYQKVTKKLSEDGFVYMEGEFHRVYRHARNL